VVAARTKMIAVKPISTDSSPDIEQVHRRREDSHCSRRLPPRQCHRIKYLFYRSIAVYHNLLSVC
ncbi:hypothetical protein ACFLUU_06140, partial [Chloroflexota bacterium]